jgi:hypothetical protein
MTTPARHLRPVTGTWHDDDPVLAALRAARARRDQADRDIRILLAYARELATPRPYRLADLAEATGKSISGIRTAYSPADVDAARRIVGDISNAHDAAESPEGGGHDLRHPPPGTPFRRQEAVDTKPQDTAGRKR